MKKNKILPGALKLVEPIRKEIIQFIADKGYDGLISSMLKYDNLDEEDVTSMFNSNHDMVFSCVFSVVLTVDRQRYA